MFMELKRIGSVVVAAILFLGWFWALTSTIATPPVASLRWLPPRQTSFMKQDGHGSLAFQFVPIEQISLLLQQAVVLAEDDQFFLHSGIDVEAMKKAAEVDWKKQTFKRGASTITMQLARNLFLSPRKSLWRKYREVLIALRLERELSKERILELYLNVAEWGDGIYGAEAAAQHYFKQKAAALSKHEAAFLAAILPRPRFYDNHRGSPFLRRRIASIERRL